MIAAAGSPTSPRAVASPIDAASALSAARCSARVVAASIISAACSVETAGYHVLGDMIGDTSAKPMFEYGPMPTLITK